MIFKQPKTGIPQYNQGRSITLGRSERQASNDWIYRSGHMFSKTVDAIVISGSDRIDLATLLVSLGMCSSRGDFARTVKNGGILLCGKKIPGPVEIDCVAPSCDIEIRRGPLFLEVAVTPPAPMLEWIGYRLFKFLGKSRPVIRL